MSFSTLTSPFASISGEAIESLGADSGANPDASNDIILEEYAGDTFEVEDLDPLSALEKYCRSDMPAQRLSYAAGIGAAVSELEPSAVSGSLIALLRELLGDVYADVRLTALQQVIPVARRLRENGLTYQADIEVLWDIVQPLLLDADMENQEAAAHVLAELTHLVALGNNVVASQKLVWAVQRLQRLPQDLMAEGALAALRLITEVVVPRKGSPLSFDAISSFAVATFKDMASCERSADVRQAVALLLPRFVRHMPAAVRATMLPGLLKTLASDTHWNVRAEVPDLLINLLAATQHQQHPSSSSGSSQSTGQNSSQTIGQCLSQIFDRSAGEPNEQQQAAGGETSHTAAAVGSAAAAAAAAAGGTAVEGFTAEERKVICDVADRLCRDASHLVKVPALAALGQLLPLLPAADAATAKPPLLALLASTAKPPATVSGVRVPAQLCAPRLSGKPPVHRQRRQQQQRRRPGRAQQQQQLQQANSVENHSSSSGSSESSMSSKGVQPPFPSPFAQVAAVEQPGSSPNGGSSSSITTDAVAPPAVPHGTAGGSLSEAVPAAGTAAAAADGAAAGGVDIAPEGLVEENTAIATAAEDEASMPRATLPASVVEDLAVAAGIDPALLEGDWDSEPPAAGSTDTAAAAAMENVPSPAAAAVADMAGAAGIDASLLDGEFEGEAVTAASSSAAAAGANSEGVQQEPQLQEQQQRQRQQEKQQHKGIKTGAVVPAVPSTPSVHIAARGTAAAELPLGCAFHLGKVARHVGSSCWPLLHPAFLHLAAAAVAGDADIAAALLLSFPDLAAALGPGPTRAVLVPVVLELLHGQLEQLAPVLSVTLYDVTAALPADLRICLLQLLPSLAIQPDREMAGDWRARLAVAEQLPAAARVLTAPQVAYCVWPLLLTLAKDPVHAVRAAAAAQVGPLLMQLPDHEVPAEESAETAAAAAAAEDEAEEAAAAAAAAAAAGDAAADGSAFAAEADSCAVPPVAAAAAGGFATSDLQQPDSSTTPAAAAVAPSAGAEQQQQLDSSTTALVAPVATAAAAEQEQQQQSRSPQKGGSRLGRMRKGLLHGLQNLQQQLQEGLQQGVDLVKESGGLQRALSEVDSQLHWLQQQNTGNVLRSIGEKISAAAGTSGAGSSSSSSGSSAFHSLGHLEGQLNSLEVIQSVVDPCKYLPTPSWPALAVDLAAFAKGSSSIERQAFVTAAGSILAARKELAQRQQQQQQAVQAGGTGSTAAAAPPAAQQAAAAAAGAAAAAAVGGAVEQQLLQQRDSSSAVPSQQQQEQQQHDEELQLMELEHLLRELQQLAGDPVPGVRCGVAAVAGSLLGVNQVLGSSSTGSTVSGGTMSSTVGSAGEMAAAGGAARQADVSASNSSSSNSEHEGPELATTQAGSLAAAIAGGGSDATAAAAAGPVVEETEGTGKGVTLVKAAAAETTAAAAEAAPLAVAAAAEDAAAAAAAVQTDLEAGRDSAAAQNGAATPAAAEASTSTSGNSSHGTASTAAAVEEVSTAAAAEGENAPGNLTTQHGSVPTGAGNLGNSNQGAAADPASMTTEPADADAASTSSQVAAADPASRCGAPATATVVPVSAEAVLGLPDSAAAVLQQCLQVLQQDTCAAVANMAGRQFVAGESLGA